MAENDITTMRGVAATASDITILEVEHNSKGEVVRNKLQACYFCGEIQSHLARHLERRHKTEPQIVQLMEADKGSRAVRITHLRNLGNFKHNSQVMKEKKGQLIVAKRSKGRKPDEYVPCTHCFAMYVESELWRHVKSCPFRPCIADEVLPTRKDVIGDGRMLLDGAAQDKKLGIDIDPDLKAVVIDHMRFGAILDVVTSDALILRFGAAMLRRSGPTKGKLIAQRMRQMARLKMEVSKEPTLASLSVLDLLAPEYFDDVVNAVKSISQSSVSERGQHVLSKPSLALQIGQSIVKCCNLKKGLGIRSGDKAMTEAAEQFLVLHKGEWTDEVSSMALASMKVKKNYTVAELPTTSDLLKLKEYCKSRICELTDKLNSGATDYNIWRELADVVLARLVAFNKRRGSEPAKLLLSDFSTRPLWITGANQEVFDALQPMEKKLVERSVTVKLL